MGIPYPAVVIGVSATFTDRVNNTGFFSGHTSGFGFLFYVLPLSVILTQYTITGYDASAHLSEETNKAANSAAPGLWRSIFYSAIGGISSTVPAQFEDSAWNDDPARQRRKIGMANATYRPTTPIDTTAKNATGTGAPPMSTFTRAGSVSTTATMAERTTPYTGTLLALSLDQYSPRGTAPSRLNANNIRVGAIDLPEGVSAADEIALEHHGGAAHPTASAVPDTSPDDAPDRR
jgi:hypothetical protein